MLPETILKDCSQFLKDSNGKPLLRALSKTGEGFRKVKLRKKSKYAYVFERHFDAAFQEKYKDLRLRSMIVHTTPVQEIWEDAELFYVFPINGYKILYNKEIQHYKTYAALMDSVIDDPTLGIEISKDLFQSTYEDKSLEEAIDAGAEVMIYGISYYYAIRASLGSYEDFLNYCPD